MTQAIDIPPARARFAAQWGKLIPYLLTHGLALTGALLYPPTARRLLLCAALYVVRMFWVTAGYHRYFSHKSFKTSRAMQFVFAFLANTSMMRGPITWAAHHRFHHRHSDTDADVHSPSRRGVVWSHTLWFISKEYSDKALANAEDLRRYPELRWINRAYFLPGLLLAGGLFFFGGVQAVVWGFLVSTVLLWHGVFTINSLSHLYGTRRYETRDTSRNNAVLALLTLGEGWHNNHHHFMSSARQGFRWWEVDITYYGLVLLQRLGLVHDLIPPPKPSYPGPRR